MTSITIKHKKVKVSLEVDTMDIEKLKKIISKAIIHFKALGYYE
jgi:hypothetical protein